MRERAARAVQAVFAELGLPAGHGRGGRGGDARLRRARTCPTATAPPTSRRRTTLLARGVSALDVALALDRARLRGRRRGGRRHAAPARLGRLPPDVGRDRARRARAVGRQRPEPLSRAGDRLPARGRALGAAAGAAARRRPAARSARPAAGAVPIVDEGGRGGARRRSGRGRSWPSARRSRTPSARRSRDWPTTTCSQR